MSRYRIAIGIDLTNWNSEKEDRFCGVLTIKEEATWTRTRATAIFYSERPDDFMQDLLEDGFSLEDFKWINISKE